MILPPSSIPWQVTGNHWICLPCIHPVDASIHLAGVVHAGSRGAIEFAGNPKFLEGSGPPLIALTISIDGDAKRIGAEGMVWERELSWLPTFSCNLGDVTLRGTIFAPCGTDAELAGAVIAVSMANRSDRALRVSVGVTGILGHRQHRVRSPRAFHDWNSVSSDGPGAPKGTVVLEGNGSPSHCAFAVASASDETKADVDAASASWHIMRDVSLAAGQSMEDAFLIGAGTEPDGAIATLSVMRRRGWRNLLASTRTMLQKMEQSTTEPGVDRLINRNLLFAFFTGIARAIDDGRLYAVRSRMPWNGRGLTISDWDALMWLLPAAQLADTPTARELLLRVCEVHGHSPGRGVNYLDGTLFEAGFSLEGASSYAIAVDEYIVQTGDDRIVDEPVLAETLYASHEDVAARRHSKIPLYSTELNPGGSAPAFRYTAHGNAVTAFALEVFSRTLDEKTAEKVQDAESVRASALRHFSAEGKDGRTRLVSSVDLDGKKSEEDDQSISVYWLPYFHLVGRDDSVYRRTVKQWEDSPADSLIARCARLIGPNTSDVLDWLRRAPLDGGIAAEFVDDSGRATGNGGDAVLSGMVAYMAWYAVHALGAKL